MLRATGGTMIGPSGIVFGDFGYRFVMNFSHALMYLWTSCIRKGHLCVLDWLGARSLTAAYRRRSGAR